MKLEIDIKERKAIWIALSEFYLDQELQDFEFRYIASKIKSSPYTLQQVKRINKEEVFPVLYKNLRSDTGIWTGFQEQELFEHIQRKLASRNFLSEIVNTFKYWQITSVFTSYWDELEKAYQEV